MSETTIETRPTNLRWSRLIRQFHRWVSVAFVLCVIATTIVLAQPEPAIWFSYVPLAPLFLLFLSGAYLFALPYFGRRRPQGD
jgi:heme/copper-type cytochrome/quinol oxidase subunit 1